MKKMVMACMCDVCGKEMDSKSSRYVVRMGVGNWNNEEVQMAKEKEMCRECYDTVVDLLNVDSSTKMTKSEKKKSNGNTVEYISTKGLGKSKYPIDDIYEAYCNGLTNVEISKIYDVPKGSIGYIISDIRKKTGAVRGENKLPEYKETPVHIRTVVDGSTGLVMSVN